VDRCGGVNVLPGGGYGCAEDCVERASSWYARQGRSRAARARVEAINRSPLAEELVEPLKSWP
jgi:hypothetical protein